EPGDLRRRSGIGRGRGGHHADRAVSGAAGGSVERGGSFVGSWLGLVRRRWRVGLLVFVLVAGGAAAVTLLSRPIYRAEARLRLGEPPPMGGVSPATGGLFALMR